MSHAALDIPGNGDPIHSYNEPLMFADLDWGVLVRQEEEEVTPINWTWLGMWPPLVLPGTIVILILVLKLGVVSVFSPHHIWPTTSTDPCP